MQSCEILMTLHGCAATFFWAFTARHGTPRPPSPAAPPTA